MTTRRIRAREELTIDYNPRLEDMGKGKKRKNRVKKNLNVARLASQSGLPDGEASEGEKPEDEVDKDIRCDCDEPNCRGWIPI